MGVGSKRSEALKLSLFIGEEGLEPSTYGFGDRRSTIELSSSR